MRWTALVLLAAGCGGSPTHVAYAAPPTLPRVERAQSSAGDEERLAPVPKPDPLIAVDTDVIRPTLVGKGNKLVLNGAKPPEPEPEPEAPKDPQSVVKDARARSLAHVAEYGELCGMDGDELVCKYRRGVTYEVFACARQPVRIELAVGEVMTGNGFVFGPNYLLPGKVTQQGQQEQSTGMTFWQPSEVEVTGDGRGNSVNAYYVRAANERLVKRSIAMFGTNIGPYKLDLVVLPTGDPACMSAVRWKHTAIDQQRALQMAQVARANLEAQAEKVARDAACEDMRYTIEVAVGAPKWTPTKVYNVCDGDHAQVIIELPDTVTYSTWPVMAVTKRGKTAVAQCTLDKEAYRFVCDNVFSGAMLRVGDDDAEEIVYLRRAEAKP